MDFNKDFIIKCNNLDEFINCQKYLFSKGLCWNDGKYYIIDNDDSFKLNSNNGCIIIYTKHSDLRDIGFWYRPLREIELIKEHYNNIKIYEFSNIIKADLKLEIE